MISVVYVTCRDVVCVGHNVSVGHNLQWVPEPEPNQYRLLSASLAAQTFNQFELVCVDDHNELPRPELDWLGDRVRFVRPRKTPWTDIGAFASSAARNTGILAARGDIVVSLDDCLSFGPDMLAQVAERAARGLYLVLHVRSSDSPPTGPLDHPRSRSGGTLAYPRDAALAVGGWEERFTGCKALEDWEFSERLVRSGVRLVANAGVMVTPHGHARGRFKIQRCCHVVRALVAGQTTANRPWTREQLAAFDDVCPFAAPSKMRGHKVQPQCLLTPHGCDCRERPSGSALAIMRGYESRPFAPW